eukprot:SAG11_NODE_19776_length_459_cov_0.619444_1_plen_48_part_10
MLRRRYHPICARSAQSYQFGVIDILQGAFHSNLIAKTPHAIGASVESD